MAVGNEPGIIDEPGRGSEGRAPGRTGAKRKAVGGEVRRVVVVDVMSAGLERVGAGEASAASLRLRRRGWGCCDGGGGGASDDW